jgi:two-component system, NarL family, sensor histidine kinase LiaS
MDFTRHNRFRKLRWKLTLSYTAVTVGALLVVEFIVFAVAAGLLVGGLLSRGLPAQFVEAAKDDFVPDLQSFLMQSPPDLERIAIWMEEARGTPTLIQVTKTIPVNVSKADLEMLVLDGDGYLLALSPRGMSEETSLGKYLDPGGTPGLEIPLKAALAGEGDVDRLYSFTRATRRAVMAVPIESTLDSRILGVLVMIATLPTVSALVNDSLRILGVSLFVFAVLAGLIGLAFGSLASRGLVRRFDRLSDATRMWSRGDFAVLVDDPSGDELGQLARRMNSMAGQLQSLLDTRSELAAVEERKRLARDLHDSAKQQAFAAAAQLDAAKSSLVRDPLTAESHMAEAVLIMDDLRKELTNLIDELRPVALQGKGLVSAVRDHVSVWSRQSGIEPQTRVQGERLLSLAVEQNLFRIIQEAMANVARHSGARHVEISLVYKPDSVLLFIEDDGHGFNTSNKSDGIGLQSMIERAESMGGRLGIESVPGESTRITCEVPDG